MQTYRVLNRNESFSKDHSDMWRDWKETVEDNRKLSTLLENPIFEIEPLFFDAKVYTNGSEINSVMSIKMSNSDEIYFRLKSFKINSEREGLEEKKARFYLCINGDSILEDEIEKSGISINDISSFEGVRDFYFNYWIISKQYNINKIV
jgi:hypothetical protein